MRLKVLACAVALLAPLFLSSPVSAQVTFTAPELLGRPTDRSVTLHVVASSAIDAYAEYGTEPGAYPQQTGVRSAAANDPLVVVLDGLTANTRYYYRLRYRQSGATDWIARDEHSFHTQRASGSEFTFTVTSDSHINIVFGDTGLYQQTLRNVDADRPDFHLDLGDTFAMDNVTTQAQARSAYLSQRPLMGLFSHSAPVFLVLGNHEQEEGWHRDDTGNLATSKPILGANARKRFFLNPVPDGFYTGNTDAWPALTGDGLPEDYYAWQWGDALFIAIDPYWYTTTKPFTGNIGGGENSEPGSGDRWEWTLGYDQYQWLKQTLQSSPASLKFIFAHHGTGGTDDYIRGGASGAPFNEWGGHDEDGTTYSFDSRRPGWQVPIHQLLVDNHVTAFFHGHDHMFAHEERDGVVYQLVPMAADPNYGLGFQNYREGDPYTLRVLPNSGHLRVTVSGGNARLDYVRAFVGGAGSNGDVPYSYTMTGVAPGTPPPLPPSPPSPPGAVSVTAAPGGGNSLTVSWSGVGSPTVTDWLAIYVSGTPDWDYLAWAYTSCTGSPTVAAASGSCAFDLPSGLASGSYEIRLFSNNDYIRLGASAPFPVGGGSGTRAQLTAAPQTVAPAGAVTASWTNHAQASSYDWLAISSPGAPDDYYLAWLYTSCSTDPGAPAVSGACEFRLPASFPADTYELRLFANNSFDRVTTSGAFVVTGGSAPGPGPAPQASLATSPSQVATGGLVTAAWNGIVTPSGTDWLALFAPGTPDSDYLTWFYTSCSTDAGNGAAAGSCTFALPSWVPPGTYELRLFANNDFVRLATGPPLLVTP